MPGAAAAATSKTYARPQTQTHPETPHSKALCNTQRIAVEWRSSSHTTASTEARCIVASRQLYASETAISYPTTSTRYACSCAATCKLPRRRAVRSSIQHKHTADPSPLCRAGTGFGTFRSASTCAGISAQCTRCRTPTAPATRVHTGNLDASTAHGRSSPRFPASRETFRHGPQCRASS